LNWEDYGRHVLQHKKDLSKDPLTALSVEGNLNRRKFLYASDATRNKAGQETGVFGWVKSHVPTLDGIEDVVGKIERLSDLTDRAGRAVGVGGTVIGTGIKGVTKLVGVATGWWQSRSAAKSLAIAKVVNKIERKLETEQADSAKAKVLHQQLLVEQEKLRLEAVRANATNYAEFERTMRELAEGERQNKEREAVNATEFDTNVTLAIQREKERLEQWALNASRQAAQNNQSRYDIALIPLTGDQNRKLQRRNLTASQEKSKADLRELRHKHELRNVTAKNEKLEAEHQVALRNLTADYEERNATHARRMGWHENSREELEQEYTTRQLAKDAQVADYVNDIDRYIQTKKADLKMDEYNVSALEEGAALELRREDLPDRKKLEKAMRELALIRQKLATTTGIKDREAKLDHVDSYGHQLLRYYKAVVPDAWRHGLEKFMSWALKFGVREGMVYALEQGGRKDAAKKVGNEDVGSPFMTKEELKILKEDKKRKKAKREVQKRYLGSG
jgi:hypothetical protein